MNLRSFLILTFIFFMFCSCGKEEAKDMVTHVHNATIKVNVYHQQDGVNGEIIYTPVNGAIAEVYKTEYDRDNSLDVVVYHFTDSSGLAVFTGLQEDYYYLRVSHLSYGTLLDQTATPDGSVSLMQFDF
ncbi:MAG: hypothetical protein IPO83_00835 [Chitinophagaceae bacterium]|nr:hypothetical protein [Chitinophagaceae bacterium]